jgi:transposase
MQVVYPCCAGIDVHKKNVVVCVMRTAEDGTVSRVVRTYATMTADLLALGDWLERDGGTHVALESTGVYWRLVFNLLEAGRQIILVNSQHMKAVPGRKTEVKDAEWIADLLRHGLLRPSFIPPEPVRELRDLTRDLTRYRKTLVQERTQEVNRLHQVLEGANIKLAAVASDVVGASGRAMLKALVDGEERPEVLAAMARGRLREKIVDLRRALCGRVLTSHRLLLRHLLAHIEFLEAQIADLHSEIERLLAPFSEAIALAVTIPGIAQTAAIAIFAEIGTDMDRFPSAKHLASWAGICPGNRESAAKRLSGATTGGNPWLRAALGEVVWAISHTADNYLGAQFHRLARTRGRQKAVVAVAHSVLVILYHMLKEKKPYADLGADYFMKLDQQRLQRHHVRRLEQLGYTVTLIPTSVP